MTDDTPGDGDPRPPGHYGRHRDAAWYYVDDDLASTVVLGPATDAEPGDDWILSFTSTADGDGNPELSRVCIRLTPRALHELYIESKDLGVDARQAGHRAECGLCGDMVDLEKAVPDKREEPVHRRCYVDAYGGPVWME